MHARYEQRSKVPFKKRVDACALIYMALHTRSATAVASNLAFPARSKSSTKKVRVDGDTGGYVILACGLDENIYPRLTDFPEHCPEITTLLRELLPIKDDARYNNQTDYKGAFSMRRN